MASFLWAGTAHAMPAEVAHMPLASRFDLTRFAVRPAFAHDHHAATARWLTADITPPPGPPGDPAMIRIRGKKVKFRMNF